ncbi:hypothetical protein PHYBOEH_003478 [Phytophthora boehmeriae]|uniref:ABC transporter domain-containing protein n=1 Tax=Phytophthora boehmeriae TaxID=109152 RepID=A0A8T1XEZ2_9STRA|nr:hypothetical protein PHYBOEH_003478 [Phytophthora boehmeriae]
MLPTMHRLDAGRTAAANSPLDLTASLSRKEKRSLKRGQGRPKKSSTSSKAKSVDPEIPEDPPAATKAPIIVATSQQSRFQTVTYDEYGKNVLLNQFTLGIGTPSPDGSGEPVNTVELLTDTQLKLNYGSRYGLVGPNGIGKSTLLQALADGLVEGLPSSLRMLYVNQLDTSSMTSESVKQSVLQTVLSADTRVSELQGKIDILQKVLMGPTEPEKQDEKQFAYHKAELLHALLTVQLMEAEQAREAASKIAIKRSGMRGKDARLRLNEAEAKVADLRQRLEFTLAADAGGGEHESVNTANEAEILREIHERTEEYQQALKVLDEASMEARARRILASMGVDPNKQDAPLSSLSGGWQVRILLARVLFMEPDFLLLDEPTNHLDMPSILWLKNYLLTLDDVLGSPVTLVVVSHDRFFLNAVVEEIVFFRGYDKTLAYYDGNYDAFEEAMATKRQFNARLQTKLDKKTEKMTAMVAKIAEQGARSKDDKKLQVAASKKKKMDRIGNERSAKGTRFKLNRDRGGYFFTLFDQAEEEAKYNEHEGGNSASSAWRILSNDPPQIRNLTKLDNAVMISLDSVSFRYDESPSQADAGISAQKAKIPLVLENLNLGINYGDKVILVGRNGAGKTTLMNLLSRDLRPKRGKVEYFHGARIASLMQHNVEDLKRQDWSRGLTPVELLRSRLETDETTMPSEFTGSTKANDGKMRKHLSSFGISGNTAVSVPIEALSGGQLVRVGLAWATFPYPPHALLLDEPTNHLDMNTIQILGEALRRYKGAVVLISHDLHFLDVLTNSSRSGDSDDGNEDDDVALARVRVFEVSKKKGMVSLVPLVNGVEAYREKEERRNASLGSV